ncbi:small conductance mechanosensitive channel [Aliiruegeria haliotis]|uniref:Small-conductance mechanosensitive channel n=1 Tax=Aliiruegeria haliotis TaxID=1280846 RepID=A0A2T0RKW3_9RHOB|nr:mechanosensitive ion channel family protein [Aliiruegeria haliotis]PRY21777.1 small conductance mechanosensitive channel [Aliiruegeria haliotis]
MQKVFRIFGVFSLVLATLALPVAAYAQTEGDPAAPAEATAEAPAEPETPGEEVAPEVPAGLDSMDMALDEFTLRLVPLTVDQLSELAKTWQGIVQEQTQDVVEATVSSRTGGQTPAQDVVDSIVDLTRVRDDGFSRFDAVVDNLEKKGGDEAVVTGYRSYQTAILLEEKQQADLRTLVTMAGNWMVSPEGGLGLLKNASVLLVALFAMLLVARVVRGYARRLFARVPDLSKLLQAFLTMVVYWLTIAIGLMVVMSMLGVDITPLFAVVGGASFIIAFAMQDTLGNLAAGLMIMFNRPFDEGDYITAGGTSGTVQSVSVVSTTVTTPDNQVIVIPNSKVWGDVITNTTASTERRVDLVFGIGYEDSIEQAQGVLEEVVAAHPMVLKDPATVIRVGELADSSVNFIVRPWVRSEDYWTVYWDLHRSVKEAFDAAGISIPFPQTDMHLKVDQDALVPVAAVAPSGAAKGVGTAEGAKDFGSGDDGAGEDDGAT